jgi:hypothetical protein
MLSDEQRQRLAELAPWSGGETLASVAGSFCFACLLEFGPPAPSQAEVEAELRKQAG